MNFWPVITDNWRLLLLVVCIKLIAFHMFKLYQGMWRYTGMVDVTNVLKAAILSSLAIMTMLFLMREFRSFSRSVLLLDGMLTVFFIGGVRVAIRLYFSSSFMNNILPFAPKNNGFSKHVLIIGAGDAGEKVLREILDNPRMKIDARGFIDDRTRKHGQMIHGIQVLGPVSSLSKIVRENSIDELLIAIPSANGQDMRKIVEECKSTGIPFKTLPGIGEMINGNISLKTIRDVAYEDLLRRPEVKIETEYVSEHINKKTILVSGAGGSIGSELCRQICKFNPGRLILLDSAEEHLFQLEIELKQAFEYLEYKIVLGNILNRDLLSEVFANFKPDAVFHAAAYKHVPLVELNPWEGVINNLVGTQNLLDISLKYEVERFVLVSTDKAVRPTNVMGATKRVAEILVQSQDHTKTKCLAVRFGNVVGSSGSVIPLFKKQIEAGGPVTVTHPEMYRYFMTIPEAAQLILQAASMGEGGEIFVLDMGTPIKIVDMAKDLIRLSGFEPERDIEIKFVGRRPGEKLYEELITEGEGIVRTEHDRIMVLNGKVNDNRRLLKQIKKLVESTASYDSELIKEQLLEIVPEYKPSSPE
ncbi:MAG: polysaccharide biosynthesis protein [Deltaproteobacteria bacterium]|nr:polysaccharide biosynthesis protein [Deltaproteobacteria bacterium]